MGELGGDEDQYSGRKKGRMRWGGNLEREPLSSSSGMTARELNRSKMPGGLEQA